MNAECGHAYVAAQPNPETGNPVYPWTTLDGQAVLSDGSVEGCNGVVCEDRRKAKGSAGEW